MADLATLKSRIASETHRSDLTEAIAYAISDAIKHYQGKRFTFNQARGTITTVAGTEFYDDLTGVASVDSVTLTVNGRKVVLDEWSFGQMEAVNSTTNTNSQPWAWSWYAEQIRLYPIPDDAYTLTVSYVQKIDAPSSDSGENAWTNEAESLIRHAAKKILYRDVMLDANSAMASDSAEAEAFRRLRSESNALSSGGLRGSM